MFKSNPHNIYFDEYRAGNLSLVQAEKKKTNIITRCVSPDASFPDIQFKQLRLRSGDRMLVCTDGVWNYIEKKEMIGFAQEKNLKEYAGRIAKKLKKASGDNYWGWVGEI